MCGRVYNSLNPNQLRRIARTNLMRNQNHHQVSYNICPATYVPTVRHHSSKENNNRELDMIKWGYQAPFGQFIINARVEDASNKKTFKDLVNTTRCVTIIEGYFEWTPNKDPFVFRGKEKEGDDIPPHLFVAGIIAPDETLIVFTREALKGFHEIHERMPLILDESEIDIWLDCENYKYEKIIDDILDEKKEKWSEIFYYQTGPLIGSIKNKSKKVIFTVDEYTKDLDKTGIKSFFKTVKKDEEKGKDEERPKEEKISKELQNKEEKNDTELTQVTQATQSVTLDENEGNKDQEKTDPEIIEGKSKIQDQNKEENVLKDGINMKAVQKTINDAGLGSGYGGFKATKVYVYSGKEEKKLEEEVGKGRGRKKRQEPTKKDELKQTQQKRAKLTKER